MKKTVKKSIASSFGKQAKMSQNSPVMTFDENGHIKYKYSPETMVDWPQFLKHLLVSTLPTRFDYSHDELVANKDQPYWLLRLQKYRCLLENDDTT